MPLASSFIVREPSADVLGIGETGRLHVLVQFERMPSKTMLENQDIRVLNLVPQNTVVLSIPSTMDAHRIHGARWVGLLEWQDKIDDSASAVFCLSPTHASTEHIHPSSEQPYLIHAFIDVPARVVESIVQRAGGFVDLHPDLPDHIRMVWAFPEVVRAIAKDTRIAWITTAGDNLVGKEPVTYCPGLLTPYGPVAEFATVMRSDGPTGSNGTTNVLLDRIQRGEDVGKIQVDGTFGNSGWDGPGLGSASLTYRFATITSDVSGEQTEIRNALAVWSEYVQVTFTETTVTGLSESIDFHWKPNSQAGVHPVGSPDTAFNQFPGSAGTTVAHAFPPPDSTTFLVSETLAGDVHFNNDLLWKKGETPDVFTEAMHEIGHSLGLEHSSVTSNVMGNPHPGLAPDLQPNDISRIRGLYASTAPTSPPGIPSGLFVNSCGCYGGAHTNWSSSSGASTYQLYRSPTTSSTPKTLLYDGYLKARHIQIPGPESQSLWVRACNTAGCSGFRKGDVAATYSQACF